LTQLLYGSFVATTIRNVKGGRWDTWSDSYNSEDDVPLPGINCFMPTDNYNLVNAGRKGDLLTYDGTFFVPFRRIPGDWDAGKEAMIYPDACDNDGHILYFGLSQLTGAPTECGVYGFGSYDAKYQKVLSLDFPISTGNMGAIDIGSVFFIGETMCVAWADRTVPASPTYGVDAIDASNKYASAYFDTRVIDIERETAKEFSVEVAYRTIPTNCDIAIWASVNGAAFAEVTSVKDTINLKRPPVSGLVRQTPCNLGLRQPYQRQLPRR